MGKPVWIRFVLVPGLTDEEMPAILEAARAAGATRAAYIVMRLPGPVAAIFEDWIRAAFPLRAEKVLSRVRSLRGGKLNDPRFGERMRGRGHWGDLFRKLFRLHTDRLGFNQDGRQLSAAGFRRSQGDLFS